MDYFLLCFRKTIIPTACQTWEATWSEPIKWGGVGLSLLVMLIFNCSSTICVYALIYSTMVFQFPSFLNRRFQKWFLIISRWQITIQLKFFPDLRRKWNARIRHISMWFFDCRGTLEVLYGSGWRWIPTPGLEISRIQAISKCISRMWLSISYPWWSGRFQLWYTLNIEYVGYLPRFQFCWSGRSALSHVSDNRFQPASERICEKNSCLRFRRNRHPGYRNP